MIAKALRQDRQSGHRSTSVVCRENVWLFACEADCVEFKLNASRFERAADRVRIGSRHPERTILEFGTPHGRYTQARSIGDILSCPAEECASGSELSRCDRQNIT